MARIRSIKPEFPQSELVGALSREARLLFIQLWTLVDDVGRTRAASRMLASLLYPYDSDAAALIEGWLGELEQKGFVRRYAAEGSTYLDIPNWLKHQKIDHPTVSKIPEFRETSREFANVSRALAPDLDRIGEDRIGYDLCPNSSSSDISATEVAAMKSVRQRKQISYSPEFDGFWQSYPDKKNNSKIKAYENWQQLCVEDRVAALNSLPAFAAHCRHDPTYRVLHCERYLSQRRFDSWEAAAVPLRGYRA